MENSLSTWNVDLYVESDFPGKFQVSVDFKFFDIDDIEQGPDSLHNTIRAAFFC